MHVTEVLQSHQQCEHDGNSSQSPLDWPRVVSIPPWRLLGYVKKNTEHRIQTIPHLIPMVYNDCNNQLFQSAAIKIKTPIRSAGTEHCAFQVLLIAGCHLSPQQGNTGLFFLSIRTAESLFCCCYHFLLSNTKSQTEGLWEEVQAPGAFLLSCLETRWV